MTEMTVAFPNVILEAAKMPHITCIECDREMFCSFTDPISEDCEIRTLVCDRCRIAEVFVTALK